MRVKKIGAFEAKTHLSAILEQVDRGQVYLITKRGRPVAELRPVAAESALRFGSDAGRIVLRSDFDAPLPDFRDYTE
jgi:prevent-host-death family protein